MKFFPTNGWFHPSELVYAVRALIEAPPTIYLDSKQYDCKYIQLYIDQRTKSFIFRNADGNMLSHEQVYAMFPSLCDDPSPIISASVSRVTS